jgi:peptidoglycan/xylan/chitin deacetylase (PgdA/CDA1 family)
MTTAPARLRAPRILRRPVALAYHAVNEAPDEHDPLGLVVSPELFEAQVSFLLRRGYRFLTAEQLLDEFGGRRPPEGTAVLTFDDGWLDALTVTAPLLSRLGLRGTFYVCPGLWGSRHWDVRGDPGRLLTEDQARQLHEAGMELGSHSMNHPDLRQLEDDALAAELSESKAALERLTGAPCRTLAYPFGLFDERVERAAGEAGYELAFAWQPGPWRALAAPRLPAPTRFGARRLALKMLGIRRRRRRR